MDNLSQMPARFSASAVRASKPALVASAPPPEDARWAALRARDASADGSFFYAVKTTGVYCRPSCAARPARPENVEFHATVADAERAGFRPCKRCKPDQPALAERRARLVAELCREIEASDGPLGMQQLAERAGLSTFHLQRVFKAVTGLTPKAYAAAARAERMRRQLESAPSITQAIYGAGYNSSGRFYEGSNALLGMTPTQYRAGGQDQRIRYALGRCTLGSVLVAQSERGVCAIQLGADRKSLVCELEQRFPKAQVLAAERDFEQAVAEVVALVENPASAAALPLDIQGTAFQRRVWQALREIPAGTTATYADVARALGTPTASRAVARACAANPLAVAIPCHRVVRSDGSLSGYRWGVERKQELLLREGAVPATDGSQRELEPRGGH